MTKINIGITISGAAAKYIYTYQDLLDLWLEKYGKISADQQKRNLKTALNKHLAYNHLSWESAIGPELADPIGPFENRLFDFGKSLVQSSENQKGLNSAYVDNLKTGLRQWHEVYVELVNSQSAEGQPAEQPVFTTLREAFKFHYAKYCATEKAKGNTPLSLSRLSLSINKSHSYLSQVASTSAYPYRSSSASSKVSLEMLEEILDVRPRGQLTQFVLPERQAEALGPHGERARRFRLQEYYLTKAEIEANDQWAQDHGLNGVGAEFTEYVTKKCAKKSTATARAMAMARDAATGNEAEPTTHPEKLWEQVRPTNKTRKFGWKGKYISPDGGATMSYTAKNYFCCCLSFLGCLRGVPEEVSEDKTIIHHVKRMDKTPYALDPLRFSMVYLCDAEMVMDVIGFLAERLKLDGAKETYTTTLQSMLSFCISLLNPDHGFVKEHPEFGNRLPESMNLNPSNEADQTTWSEWCKLQKTRLERYRDAMGEPIIVRDSFAPVIRYINTQHPIDSLLDLATIMQQKLNANKAMGYPQRLRMERDLCFVRMVTYQPLRILMYECLLTYDKNWNTPGTDPSTTAHLYKKLKPEIARGYVWAIRFANDDFKNKSTKKDGDYDIEFDDNLTDHIEHYLTNIRPNLQSSSEDNDSATNPRVFVPWKGEIGEVAANKTETEGEEGISEFLAEAFRRRTLLLPGCRGFGPHNARHLVATEYIKNEPGGIEVVSAVLHDKPETVLKHYARFLPQDIAKHYTSHVVGYIRNRNGNA